MRIRAPALLLMFLALQGSLIGGCNAQSESLPETVRRHEQEILTLKRALEALTIERSAGGQPQPAKETSACVRDYEIVGRTRLDAAALARGVSLKNTGVFLKYIRHSLSPYPPNIILASNVEELNNKILQQGSEYKFRYRDCGYALFVIEIKSQGEATADVQLGLNYH